MGQLQWFSPPHLVETAKQSGLFQCRKCGLVWFGYPDIDTCPQGPHGRPVHVALLCRVCDAMVPIEHLAEHLADGDHHLPV